MERGKKLNGTYTLIDEIGSGGGGVVYRAYHERLKTYVVVKKIKENVKGILDGRAEADILKKIKHTYLPRVYDFLEIDGEIYTVMDYIPGKVWIKRLQKKEGSRKSRSLPGQRSLQRRWNIFTTRIRRWFTAILSRPILC